MLQDVNPIIDRLIEAFPACFNRSAPQPLKIGLGEELLALAGVHPALADLTRTRIRRALTVYTGMPAYCKALVRGGPRYDLAGQPVGEVTPDPQADAPGGPAFGNRPLLLKRLRRRSPVPRPPRPSTMRTPNKPCWRQ